MEAVECAAASLAMVLAYHGHHAPLSEVRQACGISRDGSKAKNIVVAARSYGLVPRARRLEPTDLASIVGPAILHWEMNHFLVLERWTPEKVLLIDPGSGRRVVGADTFDKSFTGICIDFTLDEAFEPRARTPVSRARYVKLLRTAAGALGMVLVASLALNVLATVIPLATQLVVDRVIGARRPDWLVLIGASAVGLVTLSALHGLARGWLLLRVRARLDVVMTQEFVSHLLDLPIQFYAQRSVADLVSRVQANRTIREVLAGESVSLLADGTMLLVYLVLMLAFDARLSLVAIGAAVLYFAVFAAARPMLRAGSDEAQRKSVTALTELLQTLSGIATIKSAGVERGAHVRWLNAWIASINSSTRLSLRRMAVGTALFGVQMLIPAVILWLGGLRVLQGDLTPGRLVAFVMLQAGFIGPLVGVVETLVSLQIVPVLLGRMDDVLLSKAEPTGTETCPRLAGDIVLEDVCFRYAHTTPPVLTDVSMSIPKGKKVALVGASGSGKSTLARLLLGLHAPTSGRILIDGRDVSTFDAASVRRQYGVVLQDTALFEGTVADNLRLFYPNAPLEHIVQAARVAQIHDDIMALPQGYDTPLSAGATLSGGQRQRLALARAIVHHPPIMILDEATSALDAATELAIERYLSTRSCTRVVIAHRLSTVRDADIIFVLDDGRIAERGRHDDLVARGGLYARLAAAEGRARHDSLPPPSKKPLTGADLEAYEAFSSWTDDERTELAEHLERADFEDGSEIVQQDSRGAGLYLVVEGEVAIELSEPGLPSWTVAELGPGSIVGEISLLDGSPSSASVVARGDVEVLHLPYARFHDLQGRGDVLATRAILSLGAIVADRTRIAIERNAEMTASSEREGTSRTAVAAPTARGTQRELQLAETVLCASLAPAEVEVLWRTGTRVTLHAGQPLFTQGSLADALFVLLAGRVELRRSDTGTVGFADAGALLAESAAFDAGAHAMSALAEGEVVALSLRRDALVDLLLSGRTATRKLLAPLAETLVRRFRLANYRLRESVALQDGELDRAHAAREHALVAAREEREALLLTGAAGLPVVRVTDPEDTPAACLVALLRAAGRPVSFASVHEAFAGLVGASPLPHAARLLGLRSRRLEVSLDELRSIDAPIIGVFGEGSPSMMVLEAFRRGRWRVMDPLRGRLEIPHQELRSSYLSLGYELRTDDSEHESASLPERVAAFAKNRRRDLLRLGAMTISLQAITLALSLATALAVQRVFPYADHPLLRVVVAATVALGLSAAVMHHLQARAIEHLRAHFDRELLDQLMTHVLALPIAFFDRFPPGEVIQRFQAFENVRAIFSTQGVAALLSVSSLVVGGVLLLGLAPHLAVIPLAVLFVYALATWLLFPSLRRAATDEVRARGKQQDRLIETLKGIVTLRMAGDRKAPEQRWMPTFLDELAASLRQERIASIALPLLEWARGVGLVVTVWSGAREVLDGTLSLGAFVGFLGVLGAFLVSTHGLAVQILGSAPSLVDYGLVRATFREQREQAPGALVSPGQLRGAVSVEGVSFRYSEGGPMILRDVSLKIEPGTKVALVGASGSGKSTLGRLLLGLYLPSAGRILFDGRDVKSLDLEALRRRMGVVLQEPFLLAGTLFDNIALGADSVDRDDVEDAAKSAAIHDDIMRMGMGYSTRVSEGGTTFSGGQRQRIVIARALLTAPAVLLLDEATSALDNLSQAVIEENLSSSKATRIVIAHRLSTIVDADCIVVLERGRIVEQGSHDELLARKGPYFDLVRAQLSD